MAFFAVPHGNWLARIRASFAFSFSFVLTAQKNDDTWRAPVMQFTK